MEQCGHWNSVVVTGNCSLVALHSGCSKSLAAGVFKGGGKKVIVKEIQKRLFHKNVTPNLTSVQRLSYYVGR